MGDDMSNIVSKIKSVLKTYGLTIVKTVLPIILIIVLLSAAVYYITIDDGTYKEGDWSSTPYGASQYTSNVTISSAGEIQSSTTAQDLWDTMIESGSNVDEYLDEPTQLLKLMNAETITQFVDTRSNPDDPIDWDSINSNAEGNIDSDGDGVNDSSSLQGIIKLKRSDSSGNIYNMTYVDPTTFQSYIDEYNSLGSPTAKEKALKHFTIGSDTSGSGGTSTTEYYAKVATWSETSKVITNTGSITKKSTKESGKAEVVTDDGYSASDPDVVQDSDYKYSMTTTKVNYKDLAKGYTMPFDYLWQLLVISEDKDFVMELADLVYDSTIVITVYDNLTTNTNIDEYIYTKKEKTVIDAQANAKAISWGTVTGLPAKNGRNIVNIEKSTDYKTTTTIITKTNTLDISITHADVWYAEFKKDYTNNTPTDVVTDNGAGQNLADIAYEATPTSTIDSDVHLYGRTLKNKLIQDVKNETNDEGYIYKSVMPTSDEDKYYKVSSYATVTEETYQYSYTGRVEKYTNTLKRNTYVAGTMQVTEKTDKNSTEPNFVTIFLDPNNLKAKYNILSVESWLFELIEENEKTVDLLDLTKYLLYKATGTDYGVTSLDFSVFDNSSFKSITTSTGLLKAYIRSWEHSTPPPTNADGTKYIVEDDGAGIPTVGYGINLNTHKAYYEGLGYSTTIGSEIDIEVVDAKEDEIINQYLSQVKSLTSGLGLTDYQINALVSRAYNCGVAGAISYNRGSPSMNFVNSYNAYWNQSTDDKFEEKDNNADFSHNLYTQYMSKPVSSGGTYLLGLERRRKSEWVLFQTGYYNTLDKWHSSANSILEAADEVHQAQITWTYSVGGDLVWKDIEKSLNNPNKVTCCATFVSCVIYKAGYFTEAEMNNFTNYNSSTALYQDLSSAGWQKVNSYNDLEAGDIVFMNTDADAAYDHVQIYAGDGTWFNAGSTGAIQKASPYSQGDTWPRSNFAVALRPN